MVDSDIWLRVDEARSIPLLVGVLTKTCSDEDEQKSGDGSEEQKLSINGGSFLDVGLINLLDLGGLDVELMVEAG